jgi:hypothetical protein
VLLRQRERRVASGDDRRLLAVLVMFAAGVVLNAAVCGILSGPFPRYQSRIVWLVPAGALLAVARLRQRTAAGGSVAPAT